MRSRVHRSLRSYFRLPRLVRIFAFGLIGACLSACAASQKPNYAGVYQPPVSAPQQNAGKADFEDDGRPAQLPPVRRPLPEEDDPSQPWSPNYGKKPGTYRVPPAPPARTAALPSTEPAPVAVPVAMTASRPSRPLRAAEADTIVLRAIQNHEVLRP